jgi:hypothetical protein
MSLVDEALRFFEACFDWRDRGAIYHVLIDPTKGGSLLEGTP